MPENLEQSIVAALRDAPEHALPLQILRERLSDPGTRRADPHAVQLAIERRPDLFCTARPGSPLDDAAGWLDHERRMYERALDDTGAMGEPRVALLDDREPTGSAGVAWAGACSDPLASAEALVMALWAEPAAAALQPELGIAFTEIDRMRRRLRPRR